MKEVDERDWVRISPDGMGIVRALKELAQAWDLFRLLVGRHLKIRFAQTAMGAVWVLLQPLMTALIFSILFGTFVKVPSEGLPYVVFAYPAMVLWTFFAQALEKGNSSLLAEERLITKVYFPRLVIPLAASTSMLADFVISALLIIPIGLIFSVQVKFSVFFAILALPPVYILGSSLGMLFASLSIRFRDFRQLAPFLVQVWFYGTPVVYALGVVPENFRTGLLLNPLSAPILLFRHAFTGTQAPPLWSLGWSYGVTLVVAVISLFVFRRVERRMADWL
ncbi:MAG: ABC transporter permease [Fibrobacterota bacterium]|nr:ABC transporter permease [Fibrobacterota bacterium]QQS03691.1 MAG: ABC transporter permease [Fibrobacterota bacterium]